MHSNNTTCHICYSFTCPVLAQVTRLCKQNKRHSQIARTNTKVLKSLGRMLFISRFAITEVLTNSLRWHYRISDYLINVARNWFIIKAPAMSLLERPILSVPSKALTKLVYALTVESPLDPPRDWRGLAGYLGFPHRVITLIEQHRESSKAWHVLVLWEQTGTSSLWKLLIALMELNLKECLDILRSELGGQPGVLEVP